MGHGKILHGTQALGIEHVGTAPPTETTELLYMTDSHLGKTRHGYGASEWRVDPEAGFESGIDLAVERGVDAVLHGGDIFHNDADGIGQTERQAFEEGIKRLIAAEIPFYYIYGNHEQEDGRAVLEASRLVLSSEPTAPYRTPRRVPSRIRTVLEVPGYALNGRWTADGDGDGVD